MEVDAKQDSTLPSSKKSYSMQKRSASLPKSRKTTLPKSSPTRSSTLASKSPDTLPPPSSPREHEPLLEENGHDDASIYTAITATEIPSDGGEEFETSLDCEFGELEFIGVGSEHAKKIQKFVKVPKKSNPTELLNILCQAWGWGPGKLQPNLLISVTGGAWDFPITNHVNEVFKKGIVEAAVSANAWIITGGTNTGVMKYVGTAVGDYEMATRKHGSIVTIGIATWGTLRKDNRDEMTRAIVSEHKYVAKLSTKKASQSGVFLDPDHSYFILVDDGKSKFGADVKLRGSLEKEMATHWKVPGLQKDLPMVCIVVEGGPNTIQQAHAAVKNDAPIVVVADSGRASNIMAKAFDPNIAENLKALKKMLERITDDTKLSLNYIQYMSKMTHLVNVYDEMSEVKIDQMILRALIKANKNDKQVQLDLAQTWNRSDIVEFSEILSTDTLNWQAYNKQEEVYRDNVYRCLLNNQLGFIKLFLRNRMVSLDAYLTKAELEKLYKEVHISHTSPLYPLVTRKKKEPPEGIEQVDEVLKDIEEVLQDLTTEHFVFLSEDSKAGYDWYRSRSQSTEYQFPLPQIPEDRKTITFRVKAGRDACVSLSPINEETGTMYEIILGSSKNEKCTIKYGTNILAEVEKVNVLSPEVFRHFFVSFDRGIQVGYVGEKAFMTCDHHHEVGIKFLGFKTDVGISGVWEFCTFGYEQFETKDTHTYRYDAVPKLTTDKPSITFRIKADDKQYLALSPKKKDVQDMVEIVLSNSLSEFRIGRGNKHVAKEATPDLLSPDEFRHFYITFEHGRSIQIGRLGQKPFLKYKPSKAINFDFIGFASDVDCKGVWEFPVLGTSEHQNTNGVYKYNFMFPPLPKDKEVITFHVKSASNALIALSPEDKHSDEMYEVMLGIDKNLKSGISYEDKFISHITTEKLLSADSFKHFYISLQDDMIQVGVVGEKPFMKSERRTDVKFIGFCSDHKSPAIWDFSVFGCEVFETSKYHFDLPRVPRDRKIVTFRVKAESDAHLALRSDKDDNMYEIDLCGTGGESGKSVLKYRKQQVASASTPQLLSDEEFRHFYIYIDPRKPFQVGEVGQKPFLKHKASSPFNVKQIGFGTGHDVAGVWEFCTFEFLDGDILPDPTRQLFLYSILNKYYDMAEYFWEEGVEHIAAALTASKMYKAMAKGQHTELKELLHGIALKYEELAYGILTECEDLSEGQDTLDLLIRVSPNWGYRNYLSLAEETESRRFMSHPAVQVLLGKIWREGLPSEGQDKAQPLHREPKSRKTIGYKRIGDQSSDLDEPEETTPLRTSYEPEDYEDEQPKGCWQRTRQFFDAPRTKFWINLVTYMAFLIFFSYVMVSDQLSKKRPSAEESFLIFWVVTLIAEEVRQLVQPDMGRRANKGRKRLRNITLKAKSQIREYMSDYWNWIDIVMLLLFVVGEIIRLSPNGRSPGRIVLAMSLCVFYIRFLHFLTISKNIGPKVVMIFKMLGDLRFMIIILVIILVGYGVAVQAILYPHVTDTASVVKGILFRPTFQIYGELFLEDVTASQSEGTCSGDESDPCPEHVGWGVFFLVVYMVLSNVLLLNLLIAMFSNTYQRVQEETDLHAKFQRYSLTKEFFNRPLLPPPFIIFAHLYRMIRYILHKARILRWTIHRMERYFSDGDERTLVKMEERCAYNYIQRKRSDESSRTNFESRLKELEKKLKK